MRKGIGPIAVVIIAMVAVWTIIGVFTHWFIGEHELVVRSIREREIIKQINEMEWIKRAIAQSIKYSFYQASYVVGRQGGVDGHGDIPNWRVYQSTIDFKLVKASLDKTFLKYLKEYAGSETEYSTTDFNLDINPPSGNVVQGDSTKTTVTTSLVPVTTENSLEIELPAYSEVSYKGIGYKSDASFDKNGNYYSNVKSTYNKEATTIPTVKSDEKLELKSDETVVKDSANFSERIDIDTLELFDIGKRNFIDKDSIGEIIAEAVSTSSCPKTVCQQEASRLEARIKEGIKNLENSLKICADEDCNKKIIDVELTPEVKIKVDNCCPPCCKDCCCGGCFSYADAKVLVNITDLSKQYPVYDNGETKLRTVSVQSYVISGNYGMMEGSIPKSIPTQYKSPPQQVDFYSTSNDPGSRIGFSFSPTSCTPPCSSDLTISTSKTIPPGPYMITVTGNTEESAKTGKYVLSVLASDKIPPTISIVSPSSDPAIYSPFNLAFTITDTQSGIDKSSLKYKLDSGNLVSIPPTACNGKCETPDQTCTCTLSGLTAATGSRTLYLYGKDNANNGGSASSTFTINTITSIPVAFDFGISVKPDSGEVVQGNNTTAKVTLSLLSGTTQSIVVTSTNPEDIEISFDPNVGNLNFESTMKVSTSSKVSPGTYIIKVAGTGGGKTKTADYILNIATVNCTGYLDLALEPSSSQPSGTIIAKAHGLSGCNGKKVEFRKDSCTGEKVVECSVNGTGCQNSFSSPSSAGKYNYSACIDKNSDGDFNDTGEKDLKELTVSLECSHANPDMTIDSPEIFIEADKSHTFNIAVTNNDNPNCTESEFKTIPECPKDWECIIDAKYLKISPTKSSSSTLTVKSVDNALGNYIINLTVANENHPDYKAKVTIGFNILNIEPTPVSTITLASATTTPIRENVTIPAINETEEIEYGGINWIKIILLALLIISLIALALYFILKKRKKKTFEELYKKYGRKKVQRKK